MVTLVDHHDEPYITEQRRRCYFRRNEHCRISIQISISKPPVRQSIIWIYWMPELSNSPRPSLGNQNYLTQRRTRNITQIGQTRDLAVALLDSDPITVAPPQHKF